MNSIVAKLRKDLEAQGDFVAKADITNGNVSTGWFAVQMTTWRKRCETAISKGREGPNIVFYRTKSDNPRDHYVIPYFVARNLRIEDTITKIKPTGVPRWNLVLTDGLLRVTHGQGKVDVSQYYGARLLVEDLDVPMTEEVPVGELFREGSIRTILVNAYERNRVARERCIAYYGRRCIVCGLLFAEVYGPEAADIIHVHHLIELNKIGKEYEVDPIKDLRPVCPNCHAVIHSGEKKPYSIEDAAALVQKFRRL